MLVSQTKEIIKILLLRVHQHGRHDVMRKRTISKKRGLIQDNRPQHNVIRECLSVNLRVIILSTKIFETTKESALI